MAIDLALHHSGHARALVLLEGDALGLSPAGLEWSRDLLELMREVADRDGIDAVYKAVIDEVMGEGSGTRSRRK